MEPTGFRLNLNLGLQIFEDKSSELWRLSEGSGTYPLQEWTLTVKKFPILLLCCSPKSGSLQLAWLINNVERENWYRIISLKVGTRRRRAHWLRPHREKMKFWRWRYGGKVKCPKSCPSLSLIWSQLSPRVRLGVIDKDKESCIELENDHADAFTFIHPWSCICSWSAFHHQMLSSCPCRLSLSQKNNSIYY